MKDTKPVIDATAAPAKAPKEPKAPKEAKPPKEPRAKLAAQNGISRPADATKGTGLVWAIADTISASKGTPAARSEVMEVASKAPHNINEATVATQYGKWRTYNGLAGQPAIKKAAAVAVDENGVPSTPAASGAAAEQASLA